MITTLLDLSNTVLETRKNESFFFSIREICLRRHFSNKDTFIVFLDLKKAYDTVPTYNNLNKIECLVIRGKCLKLIENLYLSSKACVKIDSQFLKRFRIKKGVRQVCPLSPILFNFLLMIFSEIVINMVFLLEVHFVVVEVFLLMILYFVRLLKET